MMESLGYKSVLDKLTPQTVIEEVISTSTPRIVINDTDESARESPLYVNGYREESEDAVVNRQELDGRFFEGLKVLENEDHLLNISDAAYWRASSHKAANPITNVLDNDPELFWQSDGGQPHVIDVYFHRQMDIALIAIYLSLLTDESYTPKVVKVYAGDSPSDATLYKIIEVEKLNGWLALTFEDNRPADSLLKCRFLRFTFPVNHENGKDTHLRGIRVFSRSGGGRGAPRGLITGTQEELIDTTGGTLFNGYYSIR
ncbi:anaphase promoting complex subunit DOC1 KNAG_0I00250 [Huiozyma naganishii CBS 8797]|uniref:DOC domain-containing protein n=1 Tax=Huiozyma naganishii (strain ATCC MYA-139 / BCRC 22969 / CBS 8797 / KCTC 17520 / NBRC 10181 / NCYC 3082 / Yp74L-3) TaxID=1071383 RepID=J7S9Z3_HUIN7|nr:hypothetical protein KNAG_0I00250 [Kazachstania naganishii CBS 8797]CCK71816.1 hypothetical protein KNAG_0I00250 [Kazachstania naganishii CBS 8797]